MAHPEPPHHKPSHHKPSHHKPSHHKPSHPKPSHHKPSHPKPANLEPAPRGYRPDPRPPPAAGAGESGDRRPLAGAAIALVSADGQEVAPWVAGEDGSFALHDVAGGTYTLVAAAPNYRSAARIVVLKEAQSQPRSTYWASAR